MRYCFPTRTFLGVPGRLHERFLLFETFLNSEKLINDHETLETFITCVFESLFMECHLKRKAFLFWCPIRSNFLDKSTLVFWSFRVSSANLITKLIFNISCYKIWFHWMSTQYGTKELPLKANWLNWNKVDYWQL